MDMEFRDKIVLYYSRVAKWKQGFTAGIWQYLYNVLDQPSYINIGGLVASVFDSQHGSPGSFPRRRGYEFAFQSFWGF